MKINNLTISLSFLHPLAWLLPIFAFSCGKTAPETTKERHIAYDANWPASTALFHVKTLSDIGFEQCINEPKGFDTVKAPYGKVCVEINQYWSFGYGLRNTGLSIPQKDFLQLNFIIQAERPKAPFAHKVNDMGFRCTVISKDSIKYNKKIPFATIAKQQNKQFISQWTQLSHWIQFPFELSPSDVIEIAPYNKLPFKIKIDNLHLSQWSTQAPAAQDTLQQFVLNDSLLNGLNCKIYEGKAASSFTQENSYIEWSSNLKKSMGGHDFKWKDLSLLLEVSNADSTKHWLTTSVVEQAWYDSTGQLKSTAQLKIPSNIDKEDNIRISLWDNNLSTKGKINISDAKVSIIRPR